MIKYTLVSFCFLLVNSNSHISGNFKVIFDGKPEFNHTLILKNKKFKEYHGELFYSGKYSTMDLSDEKILIILENGVLKNDVTGVKYLGKTTYEIAKTNSDTLLFRQFYTNQIDEIIATGKFIKIKNSQ